MWNRLPIDCFNLIKSNLLDIHSYNKHKRCMETIHNNITGRSLICEFCNLCGNYDIFYNYRADKKCVCNCENGELLVPRLLELLDDDDSDDD